MDRSIDTTVVYHGQFGDYTLTPADLQGVRVYRLGLAISAIAFAGGASLGLGFFYHPALPSLISGCYGLFWLALGLSLATIHIYMVALHRLLQGFWLIGGIASLAITYAFKTPLAQTVVEHPQTLWGIGFTFAALTGIYFKEAFCFNRLETKLLTPLVPLILLGHLLGWLSLPVKQGLLGVWALLFLVFALRKLTQPLIPDIGDKSVFENFRTSR